MVNRVGESPYQFYGYQADGVYSTQAEADAANLSNRTGRRYNAGDVRFVDQNGDNRIDDKDRILLGSAAPSYFGGFYTQLKYKGFALSAEFSYSKEQHRIQCCQTTIGGCVYYQQPKYCSRKPLDSRRTEDRYAEGNMERSCGQQLFLFSLDGRCILPENEECDIKLYFL